MLKTIKTRDLDRNKLFSKYIGISVRNVTNAYNKRRIMKIQVIISQHAWNTTDFVQIWCACAAMYVD